MPGKSKPVVLEPSSHGLQMLQRLRDEAHRFAITYHRKLRSAEFLQSTLEGVPGVGPKRRHALIKTFGSTRAVKDASIEDLKKVDGITPALAQDIFQHFHSGNDAEDPAEDNGERGASSPL